MCDTLGGETKMYIRKFHGKRTLDRYGHRQEIKVRDVPELASSSLRGVIPVVLVET